MSIDRTVPAAICAATRPSPDIRPVQSIDALAQPEKRQDSEDDDNCADEVDDAVHEFAFRVD